MLLPGNIERCHRVNKYYRIKVLLMQLDEDYPKLYSAKALRVKKRRIVILFVFPFTPVKGFVFSGGD
jgi:hypothetical protein